MTRLSRGEQRCGHRHRDPDSRVAGGVVGEEAEHSHAAATAGSFLALSRAYARSIDWTLRHLRLMLAMTIATVVVSVWGYAQMPKGFFPLEDIGYETLRAAVDDAWQQDPAGIRLEVLLRASTPER